MRPRNGDEPHLRSTHAVTGYHLQTGEETIGHVTDFMMDDKSWAICHLVVETGTWFSGKEIVISPSHIDRISYEAVQGVRELDQGSHPASTRIPRSYARRDKSRCAKSRWPGLVESADTFAVQFARRACMRRVVASCWSENLFGFGRLHCELRQKSGCDHPIRAVWQCWLMASVYIFESTWTIVSIEDHSTCAGGARRRISS